MMTIKEALKVAQSHFLQISNEASLEAGILLAFVLNKDKTWLVAHDTDTLSDKQQKRYEELVAERMTDKPLAYIIHQREFYNHIFYVDERVLIPRPETEFIVEYVSNFSGETPKKDYIIADIGTGCGNVAVSLALALPHSMILATEISDDAATVAKKNANLHHVTDRVTVYEGSLLAPIKDKKIDIIVANLPYILRDRIPHLDNQVKNWEPRVALDGGEDGFEIYRTFFEEITHLPKQPHLIMGEIDYTQNELALHTAGKYFPTHAASIIQDHQGLSRFIVITRE